MKKLYLKTKKKKNQITYFILDISMKLIKK